jgi:hypothetical protein
MPDTDILKAKSLNNGQVIGLCIVLITWAVSASLSWYKMTDMQEDFNKELKIVKERTEYVNDRIDRKFKQAKE